MDKYLKHIPNILSALRILVSIILIFFNFEIFVTAGLIVFCILSDIFDGIIARYLKVESERGAALDTLGDIVFGVALLKYVFTNYGEIITGYIEIFIVVALIRLLAIITAAIKTKRFLMLHTIGNKITGAAVVSALIVYIIFKWEIVIGMVYFIALISAAEELIIISSSKKISPDIKGLWWLKNQ